MKPLIIQPTIVTNNFNTFTTIDSSLYNRSVQSNEHRGQLNHSCIQSFYSQKVYYLLLANATADGENVNEVYT